MPMFAATSLISQNMRPAFYTESLEGDIFHEITFKSLLLFPKSFFENFC